MGEAKDRFDTMRAAIKANASRDQEKSTQAKAMVKAMYDLANDLTFPVDAEGNVMDLQFLIPLVSFHLARCGYKKDPKAAVIEQIPHPNAGGPQVAENAVLYVPVDATGAIPEAFRAPPKTHSRENTDGWHTKTHITVNGETIKGKTK